jgi:hypothetical protein
MKIIWKGDGQPVQPVQAGPKRKAIWPLYIISSGAVLAVWSGWVGLGTLCGFGEVQPLIGIWDGLKLNAAIALPLTMEAYGFYAMGYWFDPDEPKDVRRYAQWTCIVAYAMGFLAQATYHVLVSWHRVHAPVPVVVLVAGVPVATICFAGGLLHKHIQAKISPGSEGNGQAGTGAQLAQEGATPAAPRLLAEDQVVRASLAAPEAVVPGPQPGSVAVSVPEAEVVPELPAAEASAAIEAPLPAVPEARPQPVAKVVNLAVSAEKTALRAELVDMDPDQRIEAARSMSSRQFAARFGFGKSQGYKVQQQIVNGTFEGGVSNAS